jgi:hypothetical protein
VREEVESFCGEVVEVEAGLVANRGSDQFKVSLQPPITPPFNAMFCDIFGTSSFPSSPEERAQQHTSDINSCPSESIKVMTTMRCWASIEILCAGAGLKIPPHPAGRQSSKARASYTQLEALTKVLCRRSEHSNAVVPQKCYRRLYAIKCLSSLCSDAEVSCPGPSNDHSRNFLWRPLNPLGSPRPFITSLPVLKWHKAIIRNLLS